MRNRGVCLVGHARPNRQNRALKAKALLSGSDYGRGFGSVLHHQPAICSVPQKAGKPREIKGSGLFYVQNIPYKAIEIHMPLGA